MRSGLLRGSRPIPAVRSAGLGAAAVLLAVLAGCGPAPQETPSGRASC